MDKQQDRKHTENEPNINKSSIPASTRRSEGLQDGYSDTQGTSYNPDSPPSEPVVNRDPTHSGARSSQRKPGTPASAPGREEGTAWSENKQTGQGQNPANPSN